MSERTAYAQILKSSSIMGGTAAIGILLSMARTKFTAVIIGTTGVGLLANFSSIQGTIGTFAGMGLQSSAVREVAAAAGKGDEEAVGRKVIALRRVSWLTGVAGMIAMMGLSPFISQLTFGNQGYALDIAVLGIVVLFSNLSGGQSALIQGTRRIGDLARANILGATFATAAAICYYSWMGLRGIVPTLVTSAALQLALTWYFARRVPVPPASLSWRQTLLEAGGMVRLGLVLMWSGLLTNAVGYFTVTLITQQVGLQSVGIYSAAFALSGTFANFVLNAMGADYYPRLTGVGHDKGAVSRMVNEQTEIGLLLALPGLLATMALAPWIIRIFYASEFLPAAGLLQWFILGCAGRVISWPLGFVMLALSKEQWFLATETLFNLLHVLLVAIGLFAFGIEGVAIAFFALYIGYTVAVYAVARYLVGFAWSSSTKVVVWTSLTALAATFVAASHLPLWPGTAIGLTVTSAASVIGLRGVIRRVGTEHRFARLASKIPGFRLVFGM